MSGNLIFHLGSFRTHLTREPILPYEENNLAFGGPDLHFVYEVSVLPFNH